MGSLSFLWTETCSPPLPARTRLCFSFHLKKKKKHKCICWKHREVLCCGTWWPGANVYNPLGGKGRVKGSGRQALKVFAVAAGDLRLRSQSSSQVNPLDTVCAGAAQRKYLSLEDTALRHIGFWFWLKQLRNTELTSMHSARYRTHSMLGLWGLGSDVGCVLQSESFQLQATDSSLQTGGLWNMSIFGLPGRRKHPIYAEMLFSQQANERARLGEWGFL